MKMDQNGWPYHDKLPEGFRVAKLEDFLVNGKRRIGLQFLIKWATREYFQVCVVSENLTGSILKPFIDENRVFVKN